MPDSINLNGRPFHFIGIGGIGMSALAYILAKRNLPVYGSDLKSSHITQRLQELGVHVFLGQVASNLEIFNSEAASSSDVEASRTKEVPLLPQIVCSTAIHPENAEYRAALQLGCPIFHRSDLLAALIQEYKSVAVAGTHGKTTTSSLISYVLLEGGLDPTVLVGGEVKAWEGNARVGQSPYLVAEADESDGSLVKLSAQIGVITNIELDHPDHYESLHQVINTFQVFQSHCKTVVGCIDCETVRDHIQPQVSYSLHPETEADYTVRQVTYDSQGSSAQVWERGHLLGSLQLKLLGFHNLSNALAAVAVGRLLGLEFETIAKALERFEGAKRRFEHRGEYNGIAFVDDYAHHPSEIQATLTAARLHLHPSSPIQRESIHKRIVAVFQPHRYSRTQTFLQEFAQCFNDADWVVVTDIYAAGEPNTVGIAGQQVVDAIAGYHPNVCYQHSLADVQQQLTECLQPGDLAIFLGAGNLNQIIPQIIASLKRRQESTTKDNQPVGKH
ncbi:MAG: UDP-N-acetylmuramate--L-alanine ligase [Microcoleaceae cyanobacterium]